jgi:hypothetical protein
MPSLSFVCITFKCLLCHMFTNFMCFITVLFLSFVNKSYITFRYFLSHLLTCLIEMLSFLSFLSFPHMSSVSLTHLFIKNTPILTCLKTVLLFPIQRGSYAPSSRVPNLLTCAHNLLSFLLDSHFAGAIKFSFSHVYTTFSHVHTTYFVSIRLSLRRGYQALILTCTHSVFSSRYCALILTYQKNVLWRIIRRDYNAPMPMLMQYAFVTNSQELLKCRAEFRSSTSTLYIVPEDKVCSGRTRSAIECLHPRVCPFYVSHVCLYVYVCMSMCQ